MASWTFAKTADVSEPLTSGDSISHDELPWDVYYDTVLDEALDLDSPGIRAVRNEAQRLSFFHWHLEFPNIAAAGGFGLTLGNPPWERVEVKQQEWFKAAGRDDIVDARTAALRKQLVADLETSDDPVDRSLFAEWQRAYRDAAAMSLYLRESGRYPYGGTGNVDTYAVFADHFAAATGGRMGIIAPSAILTGFLYRDFFAHLVDERRLVAAYDFENKGKRFFPEVHASFRFVTLIATAPGGADEARFAFMVHDPTELDDADRSYTLTPEQIALVNPNTKTAPVFLTPRDAKITTAIHKRHPVLIDHSREDGNPWGITFQRMFEVHDSGLFRAADQLRADGWTLNGNIFERDTERMLPFYEAKMFHHFNHRWATYIDDSTSRDVTADELGDPAFEPLPRYWLAGTAVAKKLNEKGWDHDLLFGWRNIARSNDVRTCVATALPRVAPNHACLLMFPKGGPRAQLLLQAILSSYAFDFLARAKMSGTNFIYAIMEQLVVPRPGTFDRPASWRPEEQLGDWVARRSTALSATSERMSATLGYELPVVWKALQREAWRVELDAAMFHLYGYSRDEVDYVMETFPIVARKDRQIEGLPESDPNWRTKRLVLAKYDELFEHARVGTPYASPDPPPPLPEKLQLPVGTEVTDA